MIAPESASDDSLVLAPNPTEENAAIAPFGDVGLVTNDAPLGLETIVDASAFEVALAPEPAGLDEVDFDAFASTVSGLALDADTADALVSKEPRFAAVNSNDGELADALDAIAGTSTARDIEAVLDFIDPNLATHVAVKNGSFFDPATFGGNLPGDGARVIIPEGITVTYDRDENVPRIDTLRVDGVLDFATNRDTQLLVDLLVVYTGGELRIGTEANPVRSDVDARITFAPVNPNQRAIDTQDDPLQVRRGLVALPGSTTQVVGSERTDYVALADGGASAGDNTLSFDSIPQDWQVGDRIVLTGTEYDRQGSNEDNSRFQDEELTITGINRQNKTIAFSHNDVSGNRLRFDHQAPEGFDLDIYVANLTRNVVFESERGEAAPLNERGYTLFYDQDLLFANAALNSLGRWNNNILVNNPVLNADGSLQAGTGTNRSARAPLCIGATLMTGSFEDEAARLLGNVVTDSESWGFAINGSRAVFEDNVAFDVVGAGFVTVSGDEIATFRDNLAIKATGAQKDPVADLLQLDNTERGRRRDLAVRGNGFWFDSSYSATTVQGNIAVSTEDSGFLWYGQNDRERGNSEFNGNSRGLVEVPVSSLPPDLRFIAGGEDFIPAWQVPNQTADAWSDNTSYNGQGGLEVRGFRRDDNGNDQFQFGSDADIKGTFQGFTAWGVREFGVEVRYSSSIRIEDSLFVGDIENPIARTGGKSGREIGHGIWINKNARGIILEDNRVEGFEVGAIVQQTGNQSLQLGEEASGDILGPGQLIGGTFANNTFNLGAASGRTGRNPSDTVIKDNPPFNPRFEISGNLNFAVPAGDRAPVADFTAAVAGDSLTVAFDASGSFDPDYGVRAVGSNDNSITSYAWDFDGDGKVDDFGYQTDFTYDAPGTYTATLRVYDQQGATATREVTVEVGGGSGTFTPDAPSAPEPTAAPQPTVAPPEPVAAPEPGPGNIAVSKTRYNLLDRPVGARRTSTFDLEGIPSGGVELSLTVFDLDAPAEAEILLNDRRLELPAEIYASGGTKTGRLRVAPDILQAGQNELTFVFADDLNGTTTSGYRIDDIAIAPIGAAKAPEPTAPTPAPAPGTAGLTYRTYRGSFKELPDFATLTPLTEGTTDTFTSAVRPSNDRFAIQYEGFIEIPQSGEYTFYTTSDDGSQLFIGDRRVVNNDGLHAARTRSGKITLEAGVYPIAVEYFENAGNEVLKVEFAGPNLSRQVISSDYLFSAPPATPQAPLEDTAEPEFVAPEFSKSRLNFFGRSVGTELSSTFELASVPSRNVELKITAFDIDAPEEAELFLNGKRLELPEKIFADNATPTGKITVASNLLREGKNELTFVFADNLNGTTGGYRVENLALAVA